MGLRYCRVQNPPPFPFAQLCKERSPGRVYCLMNQGSELAALEGMEIYAGT
jgi:hypothetical protein